VLARVAGAEQMRLPLAPFWHQNAMQLNRQFLEYRLRTPAEPEPFPVREPPAPPENPDLPVREPEPDVPNQI
jgi:hypothetical protein